ncbi:phage tail protein [Loktanella atrilutea]|nr:phage tail protein [Loktanella atrilutea]
MALGLFQFEALGFGFNDRSKSQKTSWAKIPVAGGMDRMQWTGGDSQTETIGGVVFSHFGGQLSLEGIKAAAANGLQLPLVDATGNLFNVFGMYVVEDISEQQNVFDGQGAPLRNAYSISLTKYQGGLSPVSALSAVVGLFS